MHTTIGVELRQNPDHRAADAREDDGRLDEPTYRTKSIELARRIRPWVYRYGVKIDKGYQYRRSAVLIDSATDLEDSGKRMIDAVWIEKHEDFERSGTKTTRAFRGAGERCILYLFGGGFSYFTSESYRPGMPWILNRMNGKSTSICLLEPRTSPEHMFPAALDDVVATYVTLLTQYKPGQIAFAGDSSGSGLALSVCARLKTLDIPLPACLVLMSPWTDLSCSSESWRENAEHDVLPSPQGLFNIPRHYLGPDHKIISLNNSLVSPAFTPKGGFEGFPPTLIQVGGSEVLLDDARAIAKKFETDGCEGKLEIYDGMIHLFQCFVGLARSKSPDVALNSVARFFERWLD
ncbi:Alpha/Beta hydrolase protein [Powellomyces hirtus]|nr:Alpha/Beta hydrolase protein [Powellomyces hirtus]